MSRPDFILFLNWFDIGNDLEIDIDIVRRHNSIEDP